MADFFTRLAERTLGLANTIQPVLTPFFAPGTLSLDTGLEAEQALEAQDRSPQPRSRSQSAIRSEAEAHAARSVRPGDSQQGHQLAPRSLATQPSDQNLPPGERAASRAMDSDHWQDAHLPIFERAENRQPVQPSAASRPIDRVAQAPRLVEDSTAPPVTRFPSRSRPAEPVEDPAPRTQATIDRSEAAQPNRQALLPLSEEQRALRPEQRSDAPDSTRAERLTREQSLPRSQQTNRSPEPPAQPAPQIHVSIGRIEVRAVAPPPQPAPQQPAPPAPRMSLDDYLRSQSGGRR